MANPAAGGRREGASAVKVEEVPFRSSGGPLAATRAPGGKVGAPPPAPVPGQAGRWAQMVRPVLPPPPPSSSGAPPPHNAAAGLLAAAKLEQAARAAPPQLKAGDPSMLGAAGVGMARPLQSNSGILAAAAMQRYGAPLMMAGGASLGAAALAGVSGASGDDSGVGDDSVKENTGRWTYEEHRLFLKGLELHGKGWKKIAGLIRTRTVVQIRTHAQKYFQKLQKAKQSGEHGDMLLDMRNRKRRRCVKRKISLVDMLGGPTVVAPSLAPFVTGAGAVEPGLYRFLSPVGIPGAEPPGASAGGNGHAAPGAAAASQANGTGGGGGAAASAAAHVSPPQWYRQGRDVDDLLKEAEGLDWLADSAAARTASSTAAAAEPGYGVDAEAPAPPSTSGLKALAMAVAPAAAAAAAAAATAAAAAAAEALVAVASVKTEPRAGHAPRATAAGSPATAAEGAEHSADDDDEEEEEPVAAEDVAAAAAAADAVAAADVAATAEAAAAAAEAAGASLTSDECSESETSSLSHHDASPHPYLAPRALSERDDSEGLTDASASCSEEQQHAPLPALEGEHLLGTSTADAAAAASLAAAAAAAEEAAAMESMAQAAGMLSMAPPAKRLRFETEPPHHGLQVGQMDPDDDLEPIGMSIDEDSDEEGGGMGPLHTELLVNGGCDSACGSGSNSRSSSASSSSGASGGAGGDGSQVEEEDALVRALLHDPVELKACS